MDTKGAKDAPSLSNLESKFSDWNPFTPEAELSDGCNHAGGDNGVSSEPVMQTYDMQTSKCTAISLMTPINRVATRLPSPF